MQGVDAEGTPPNDYTISASLWREPKSHQPSPQPFAATANGCGNGSPQADQRRQKRARRLGPPEAPRGAPGEIQGTPPPKFWGAPKRISGVRSVLGRRLGPQVAVSVGGARGGRGEAGDGGRRKEEKAQ